jgi:hypothetical protein
MMQRCKKHCGFCKAKKEAISTESALLQGQPFGQDASKYVKTTNMVAAAKHVFKKVLAAKKLASAEHEAEKVEQAYFSKSPGTETTKASKTKSVLVGDTASCPACSYGKRCGPRYGNKVCGYSKYPFCSRYGWCGNGRSHKYAPYRRYSFSSLRAGCCKKKGRSKKKGRGRRSRGSLKREIAGHRATARHRQGTLAKGLSNAQLIAKGKAAYVKATKMVAVARQVYKKVLTSSSVAQQAGQALFKRMPRLASIKTGNLYIKCLTNPGHCNPKRAKTPTMSICFTELGCAKLKKAPPPASLVRTIRIEAKKLMKVWLLRHMKFEKASLPLASSVYPYRSKLSRDLYRREKHAAAKGAKYNKVALKIRLATPVAVSSKLVHVQFASSANSTRIKAFLARPRTRVPFDEIAKRVGPKRLGLAKVTKGLTRPIGKGSTRSQFRYAIAGNAIQRQYKRRLAAIANKKKHARQEKVLKKDMDRIEKRGKTMRRIPPEIRAKLKAKKNSSKELFSKIKASEARAKKAAKAEAKLRELKTKRELKSGKLKKVKVVKVVTKFALKLRITKAQFTKKQKKINAGMSKDLGVSAKAITSKLVAAGKKDEFLQATETTMTSLKKIAFVVTTIKKSTKKGAKKGAKKPTAAALLKKALAKVQSGKLKLAGVKIPKQVIKPSTKSKVSEKIVKVPINEQPVPTCAGKGQAPTGKPKVLKPSQVARALKMDKAIARNILRFKAYAIAAHDALRDKLLDSHSRMSAIGAFVYQFGSSSLSRKNVAGEYLGMEAQFLAFYCIGIGKYLMEQLARSMRLKGGLVIWGKKAGKNVIMLNFKRLGLTSSASFTSNWAVSQLDYTVQLTKDNKAAKQATTVQSFSAGGCKCLGVGKFSTCKKWFAYDKNRWCVVNRECKGAKKNPRLGFWRYCD